MSSPIIATSSPQGNESGATHTDTPPAGLARRFRRGTIRACDKHRLKGRNVADHPNKHIREALRYAERNGWKVTKASSRAHIWAMLWCPRGTRDGCRIRVMSTPRNPERHACEIRRDVDRCQHQEGVER